MVRIRENKWQYFKEFYKMWGFEYMPYIPKLRNECYLNKKYNVVVYVVNRAVETFECMNTKFDLILDMNKYDLLETINVNDDERMRMYERVQKWVDRI